MTVPDWLAFVGSFAGIVLTFLAGAEVDVPQFRREWRASARRSGRCRSSAPFVGGDGARLLGARLESRPGRDRRPRALDHEPRRRLRRARRDRPQPARSSASGSCRATFVTDILARWPRSRSCSSSRTLWIIPFVGVSALLIVWAAEDRAVVLRPLRRPGDRAGDQARLRRALPAHVARRARRTRRPCCRRSSSAWR